MKKKVLLGLIISFLSLSASSQSILDMIYSETEIRDMKINSALRCASEDICNRFIGEGIELYDSEIATLGKALLERDISKEKKVEIREGIEVLLSKHANK